MKGLWNIYVTNTFTCRSLPKPYKAGLQTACVHLSRSFCWCSVALPYTCAIRPSAGPVSPRMYWTSPLNQLKGKSFCQSVHILWSFYFLLFADLLWDLTGMMCPHWSFIPLADFCFLLNTNEALAEQMLECHGEVLMTQRKPRAGSPLDLAEIRSKAPYGAATICFVVL